MIYSACKLNEQGDSIQPWSTPFLIWNQSVVSCPVLTVASWPAYRFLRRQVMRSGIPICWRIFCSLWKWLSNPVFLPRESPWTEKPGRLQSTGLQRVRHNWVTKCTKGNKANGVSGNLQAWWDIPGVKAIWTEVSWSWRGIQWSQTGTQEFSPLSYLPNL